MQKSYSEDQVMAALIEAIMDSNAVYGIKTLTHTDHMLIGYVRSAFAVLNSQPVVVKKK